MKPNPSASDFNFDTKILRYLLGIVEEGSLSKAAEKFYISQPALSRYLKKTEDALHIKLFTHTNNHLEPTDAGKVFLNGARSILHIEESALRKINDTHRKEPHLDIWTEDFFLPALKENIYPLFRQAYPAITLQFTVSTADEICQNLANGTADFGLFWGQGIESPFFTCLPLFESDMVFCLSSQPDTPVSGRRLSSWIKPDAQFLLSRKNSYMRHLQEQILEEQGIHSPLIGGELSAALLKELLNSGYGNSFLPRLLAELWVGKERIHPISPTRSCHALLGEYQGRPATEATAYFRQLVQEHITREFPFL